MLHTGDYYRLSATSLPGKIEFYMLVERTEQDNYLFIEYCGERAFVPTQPPVAKGRIITPGKKSLDALVEGEKITIHYNSTREIMLFKNVQKIIQ